MEFIGTYNPLPQKDLNYFNFVNKAIDIYTTYDEVALVE